jgi:uncharacterized membrane protein
VTDVTVETEIARPRDEVAAYVTDWRNDPSWIGALRDVRLETDGPFGVGSRVARVASFLGRRIEYVNEVAEYEPGRRLLMRSVKAPFPMTVLYEFEDAGDGTRVRIRAGGDASGFYRLAGPLLDRAVARGIRGDLARLKALLESARA